MDNFQGSSEFIHPAAQAVLYVFTAFVVYSFIFSVIIPAVREIRHPKNSSNTLHESSDITAQEVSDKTAEEETIFRRRSRARKARKLMRTNMKYALSLEDGHGSSGIDKDKKEGELAREKRNALETTESRHRGSRRHRRAQTLERDRILYGPREFEGVSSDESSSWSEGEENEFAKSKST